MNKSKFETARDEKCAMYYKNEKSIAFKIGADWGANWGAAYERERAAKLVEALKEIKERVDLEDVNFDICQEALSAYESEE